MRNFRRQGLLCLLTFPSGIALGACGGDVEPYPPLHSTAQSFTQTKNDSAGWTLASWAIDTIPYLKIGEVDGPEHVNFTYISAVAETPDGKLIVSDERQFAVRVFGPDGTHITSWTRGEGPGEFANSPVARAGQGDSVVAMVRMGPESRISRFSIAGGFSSRVDANLADFAPLAPEEEGFTSIQLLPGGSYLLTGAPGTSGPQEQGTFSGRDTTSWYWVSPDMRSAKHVGRWPGQTSLQYRGRTAGGGNLSMSFAVPLTIRSVHAIDPLGRRLCIGDGEWPRIVCYNGDSSGVVIDWEHQHEAVSDSLRQSVMERMRSSSGRQADLSPEELAAVLDQATLPTRRAAFNSIHVDSDLNVWVDVRGRRNNMQPVPHQTSTVYTVFSREGKRIGDVVLPRLISVHQIMRDHIVATISNNDNVPSVVLYRLRN